MFAESLHVHSQCLMFSNLQTLLRALVDWDQQVLNPLVVDLKHGDVHLVLLVLLFVVVHPRENLLAADGHDPLIGTVADH